MARSSLVSTTETIAPIPVDRHSVNAESSGCRTPASRSGITHQQFSTID